MLVDLEFDYDETTAAMDIFSQNDIDEIRLWIQSLDKSKCVPKDLTDKQIVLFYNACYGDIKKVKQCIQNYYNCRKNAPELFSQRVMKTEDLRKAAEVGEFFLLPGKSSEGHEVLFHRLHDTDASKYDVNALARLMFMTVDLHLTSRGPQSGYMLLFDMKGFNFGHLTKMSISTIRKTLPYLQEAVPVRVCAIHVLNTEPILDKLLFIVKPFMDKKFYDMIKFHNKNQDREELYKIVPQSNLPSDYGGSLPDAQTLHKDCMRQLQLLEPYFDAEEEQRLITLPDKKGDRNFFLESTFKKLDID